MTGIRTCFYMTHMIWFYFFVSCCVAASLAQLLGRRPPVSSRIMDNILRGLENLSRHELVWLNTYLAGRLRALPPENVQQVSPPPEATPTTPATSPENTCQSGTPAATVAPLPERIEALNYSLDPWECTGAAPQVWANHLQQSMVPIQGYIQLRPQAAGSLGVFGATCQSAPGSTGDTDAAAQPAPRRLGKASPSVSIFARDPLCKNTCRYCRCRPCDVGIEQRLLHPEGVPGAPWQPPLTPGCESWCAQCTSQRCAVRGPHDLHVCMRCERSTVYPTPVGGGDPWAAPE